nr:hypothetical protein [Tanacetum cinerariifolium]
MIHGQVVYVYSSKEKIDRMMLDSINNDPLVYRTIKENGQTRPMKYSELTKEQQLQDDCDVQTTNIILHSLSPDVYALIYHQEAAKDTWDIVKLLMKGTELSYQERECRLYNLFDKFAYVQGETLYEYYWRFSQLINDMHTIGMTMQQVHVNTKFLNALPSEWSNFVTDVKLAKSLYTTNYDQFKEKIRLDALTKQWHSYLLWHQGFYLQTIKLVRLPILGIKQPFKMAESQFNKFKKDNLMVLLALETKKLLQLQKEIMQLTEDLEAYDSDCDDLSSAKANLMANLSSCDHEVLSESQEKDTVIRELKDRIKSLSGKDSVENVTKDIDEIKTINIELEHSVAKLLLENENLRKEQEHLKSIYKDQFDSIRKTRVQSKEHSLKNKLKKLKGKNVVDTVVSKPKATIAPGMFKLDIEPISHRLKNNRDAHEELLVHVSQICPNSPKPSEKLVAVTPMNKDKRVRFAEPITSSSNIPKQIDSLKIKDSNKPFLTST